MSNLPHKQSRVPSRPARVRPAEYTPAVLRIEDGSCTQATLQLFSLTGGLLSLAKPLDNGSRPRLMFLTKTGPVLGVAEMLRPVSWTEQPFRFVGLNEDDQRRLRVATQGPIEPCPTEAASAAAANATIAQKEETVAPNDVPTLDSGELWIQKYRAALDGEDEPRGHWPRIFAALTAASLAAAVLIYVMQTHFVR